MPIKKKSIDTLKQQKINFVNYIKTKEKYSKAIGDLFFDNDLEKIDNMEDLEKYLEEKGFSKELIGSLKEDYMSYLKGKKFYGPKGKYSDEVTESIKSNDKILKKLKNNIVKEYNSIREFISFDVKEYVDEKFSIYDKKEFRDIKKEISNLNKDINKLKNEINDLEKNNLAEDHNIFLKKTKLNGLNIFQFSKKKKLRKVISESEQKIEGNKSKIEELLGKINKKKEEHKKLMEIDNKITFKLRNYDDIKDFFGGKNRTDKKSCNTSIKEIISELNDYIEYIPERSIIFIKEFITESIFENLKEKKNGIVKMLNSYFNYYYFGEDKNQEFLGSYRYNSYTKTLDCNLNFSAQGVCPTIYSKDKIDIKINDIINELGGKIETEDKVIIDKNFVDDVFIHTTGFNVLDEILSEGGLISTNEAWKRARDYKYCDSDSRANDIKDSITQTYKPHKDIYFSRGFRKNGYGTHKSENSDDYIFIVNTMSNFANNGYGVPLNGEMQPNPGFNTGHSQHDTDGYSIISKSALNNPDSGYSRIDMKDFYIFVPETKRKEIEGNPKYKTKEANIVYIPERFKGRMSYELYEFIKNEIAKKEKNNEKRTPIPRKIINSKDNIDSINSMYKWAFCEKTDDVMDSNFNPLNGSKELLLTFLKNESTKSNAFKQVKRQENFEIDFEKLETFLLEQNNNIKNIKAPSGFSKELVPLVAICSKVGLRNSRDGWRNSCLADICDKVGKFGYTSKEVGMIYQTVGWLCYLREFRNNLYYNKTLKSNFFDYMVKGWCEERNVDFGEMIEFLKQLILVTRDKEMADWIVKNIF